MKKADLLRLMAAIIYPAVDDVDTAMDKADEIYDKYNLFDPNTKEYEEGNDPEHEKNRKSIEDYVYMVKSRRFAGHRDIFVKRDESSNPNDTDNND